VSKVEDLEFWLLAPEDGSEPARVEIYSSALQILGSFEAYPVWNRGMVSRGVRASQFMLGEERDVFIYTIKAVRKEEAAA